MMQTSWHLQMLYGYGLDCEAGSAYSRMSLPAHRLTSPGPSGPLVRE